MTWAGLVQVVGLGHDLYQDLDQQEEHVAKPQVDPDQVPWSRSIVIGRGDDLDQTPGVPLGTPVVWVERTLRFLQLQVKR